MSSYEQFIAANEELFKCMEDAKLESVQAMSEAEQMQVCRAEGDAVAQFLKQDQVSFRSLLDARLGALKQ